MMKKAKELKQTRKNNHNFFKYIQPTKASGFSNNLKIHTRSMMDLESNVRYNQSAREVSNQNKQNHHLSACNHIEQQQQQIKSNSLKKFLSLFGTNPTNNPILNPPPNSIRATTGRQQKLSGRGTNRQVFTCNIKNVNVNVSNSKQKDNSEIKNTLVLKSNKPENNSLVSQLKSQKEELQRNLDIVNQQAYEKERMYRQKVKSLQSENSYLKKELAARNEEKLIAEEKWLLQERSLQKKIQNLQKNISKQRCREHELVIESLKKVINEQLRKIIQLQKSKIQREQIIKLQQRINKNMSNNQSTIKQKMNFLQAKQVLSKIKDGGIKIVQDSFNQSALTSNLENEGFEMIEEVEEHEESSHQQSVQDGDSILEEVDKYLVQWRKRI